MTGNRTGAWLLVAAVLVTTICTVGYLAAPFDDAAAPAADPVGVDHRIVATTPEGDLITVDSRSGHRSEPIAPELGTVELVDTSSDRETAFVRVEGDDLIVAVTLASGLHRDVTRAEGPVAVGPLSFPQLRRSIDRPDVDQMAHASASHRRTPAIEVENLTTGSVHLIGPLARGPAVDDRVAGNGIDTVDDLAWRPHDNRLFGVADDGRVLFRLDADRADSLAEAETGTPPGRVLDVTSFADGIVAVVVARGETRLVALDGRSFQPSPLEGPNGSGRMHAVDSNAADHLLVVTGRGELWVRSADQPGAGEWRRVATDLEEAKW